MFLNENMFLTSARKSDSIELYCRLEGLNIEYARVLGSASSVRSKSIRRRSNGSNLTSLIREFGRILQHD